MINRTWAASRRQSSDPQIQSLPSSNHTDLPCAQLREDGVSGQALVLKRVAFVCAMPMEITPLKRKLFLEKTTIGSLEVYAGSLGNRPVVAIVTGVGNMLAAQGVERLVEATDIEHVIVVGIAGAVDHETPIGTVVLPAVVVNGTTGAEFTPTQLGGGKPRGKMWTSDELITDLAVIARLRANDVVSLDMETAAVAEICQRRNIPWSVFRAISDRATEVTLDDDVFHLINRDGTFNIKLIATFFVKRPGRLPALARLAKDARLAAEHAAAAAVSALSHP
jgi:adenosylhomocysteine nucleosidase